MNDETKELIILLTTLGILNGYQVNIHIKGGIK